MMMEAEEEDSPPENTFETKQKPVLTPTSEPDNPQTSLQVMTSSSNYQTMRVKGLYCKKILQILLNSGSTHNFFDIQMAKKLRCKLIEIKTMSITGGGGHKLEAPFVCKQFK